jgi:hypothetical protein
MNAMSLHLKTHFSMVKKLIQTNTIRGISDRQ